MLIPPFQVYTVQATEKEGRTGLRRTTGSMYLGLDMSSVRIRVGPFIVRRSTFES